MTRIPYDEDDSLFLEVDLTELGLIASFSARISL